MRQEGETHFIDTEIMQVEVQTVTKRFLLGASILCLLLSFGACSKGPSTYYPLDHGKTWRYEILGQGAENLALTVTNLAPRQLDGTMITPQRLDSQILGQRHYLFEYYGTDLKGIYRFAVQREQDAEPQRETDAIQHYILKGPMEVGNRWIFPVDFVSPRPYPESVEATIEATNETVDVPAGTFKGCIKVRIGAAADSHVTYEWFAPSVGMVKGFANGSSIQLVSFTK